MGQQTKKNNLPSRNFKQTAPLKQRTAKSRNISNSNHNFRCSLATENPSKMKWHHPEQNTDTYLVAYTYSSHSSCHSTFSAALSLTDVWNFSLPRAMVVKQLLVPFFPLHKMPLARWTKIEKQNAFVLE